MAYYAFPETLAWITPFIAIWATFWAFLQKVLPDRYRSRMFDTILPYTYYEVHEIEGFSENELYNALIVYLSDITGSRAVRSHLHLPKNARELQFTLSSGQYIYDTFLGVTLRWVHDVADRKGSVYKYSMGTGTSAGSNESRVFELKLPRRNKGKFLDEYIHSIVEKAKSMDKTNRELRLHSNKREKNDSYYSRLTGPWSHIPFRHPANFDTIALEKDLKESIISDLEEFTEGKDFYRRVGKAWKRGYLLYGPPGTGKYHPDMLTKHSKIASDTT